MTHFAHAHGEAQIPAPSANIPSGKFLSHAVLGACMMEGLARGNAVGDPIHVKYAGLVRVDSASATTFAAGATVEIDSATDLAVADATGTFDIGRAVIAKTAGQTSVLVQLNS